MQMKKSNAARRAWNILRLAILWARKGGLLRRRLMLNLPKYIKSLRHHERGGTLPAAYGERQMSFDTTPVIHVRMYRPSSLRFKLPNIPCINPAQVEFDFDFNDNDDEGFYNDDVTRKSFLKSADDDEEYYGSDQVCDENTREDGDKGIDMKAEEFIAKFYEQIKLQRQSSYLEYHDRNLTIDQNCT